MAKDLFTDQFQAYMIKATKRLLHNKWGLSSFDVEAEQRCAGDYKGFIDILIKDSNNLNAIIGIEIEHYSKDGC